jgi:hypothetical protein
MGTLAWTSPTDGSDVASAGLTGSFTDSAAAGADPGYAPVYFATFVNGTSADLAYYVGTARSFPVVSYIPQLQGTTQPLSAGTYTVSLFGYSGFFTGSGLSNVTVTPNITGLNLSGTFFSSSSAGAPMSVTLH